MHKGKKTGTKRWKGTYYNSEKIPVRPGQKKKQFILIQIREDPWSNNTLRIECKKLAIMETFVEEQKQQLNKTRN